MTSTNQPKPLHWEKGDTSRIPFAAYTQAALHQVEMDRFFYQKHWCYVGLEVEVPEVGDFITLTLSGQPVLLLRDAQGDIQAFFNRCAHKGSQLYT